MSSGSVREFGPGNRPGYALTCRELGERLKELRNPMTVEKFQDWRLDFQSWAMGGDLGDEEEDFEAFLRLLESPLSVFAVTQTAPEFQGWRYGVIDSGIRILRKIERRESILASELLMPSTGALREDHQDFGHEPGGSRSD